MKDKVPPQNSEIPVLTPRQKRRKIILLLAALIGVNVLVFGGLYSIISKNDTSGKLSNSKSSLSVKPSPYPFSEITIPSLRERTYSSKLNEREALSENSNYSSYLTSYDSDGFKINGLLTIPKGEELDGGWPAIVFVHGYIPPSLYTTTGNYSAYVDYLARNGFVVFKIDLRGHGESEGEAGGGYYGSDYIVDTLNARAALQGSDFVNPGKVGLWGHSMAGNVITRALSVKKDIPAIVIWGGAVYTYSDMQKYGIDDNSYRPPTDQNINRSKRQKLVDTYGQFDPENAFWKQVPFTNYLDGITGAISINHTVDDPVVNVGYSRDLNAILDKTKIPHELNEYPTGGHNFTGSAFDEAMNKTVEFYNRYF